MRKGIDYVGVSIIFFCHDGQGNFIMAKRSAHARDEQGAWDVGGGALEFGATVEETLRAEITEEYGTIVLKYEFLGYRDVFRNDRDETKTHWLAMDFKVLVDPKHVYNAEPHKFDEIGWFRFENLPHPLHSQLALSFEKYKDRLMSNP
jgi:8-oxo-dGTP diphosphatase